MSTQGNDSLGGLYRRYARRDLAARPGVTVVLALLLVLSAFLTTTGAIVVVRLVGSVDRLLEDARPPHFLQMHVGDHDEVALDRFAAAHPDIESWHVTDLLGVDSAGIAWHRPSDGTSGDLSESLIDNLFVVQNESFDFLLDANGAVVRPRPGEVYVPVAYEQRFELAVGDTLALRTDAEPLELVVAGFVRDAQMASSLASATRFLVAPSDHDRLAASGVAAPEIIVEYRLDDPAATSDLQRAYEADPALPKNGQAVTAGMIRLVNVFSDGLVALALAFAGAILVVIAVISLRFVIRGSVHDRARELGALRAIGIEHRTIRRLFLTKYVVLTAVGCVVGYALAIPAASALTRQAEARYAEAEWGWTSVVVPLGAVLVVAAVVVGVCGRALRVVRRFPVITALVHGTIGERRTRVPRARLATRGLSWHLSWVELRAGAGQWVLLPMVAALVTVLVALPLALLTTFRGPDFVTYLGAPDADVRIDLAFSEQLEAQQQAMATALSEDDRVREVTTFANVLVTAYGPEGPQTLRAQVGDHATADIAYVDGAAPHAGEVALSALNAQLYEVARGDHLDIDGRPHLVSGVYQDVTSGGLTAKLAGDPPARAVGYVFHVTTADAPGLVADLGARFPDAAVVSQRDYVAQTLGYVTDALTKAVAVVATFGSLVVLLITTLFLSLRVTQDRRRSGILLAMGFTGRELARQVTAKAVAAVGAGVVLGVAAVAFFGEALLGRLMGAAGFGIVHLSLTPAPFITFVGLPITILALTVLAALAATVPLRRARAGELLTS